jgi:cathepsin L
MAHEEKAFLSWMREYNQMWAGEEYSMRFGIFMTNARCVQEFRGGFRVDLNEFACYTPAEYRTLLGSRTSDEKVERVQARTADIQFDWRTAGVVTPVKYQGQCGSCWTFGAIAACEGTFALFDSSHELTSFSESNIVDCDKTSGGCNGGWPLYAFNWIINNQTGKIMTTADYPYQPKTGTCQWNATKAIGHFSKVMQANDEDAIAALCQKYGPIATEMDAGHSSYQFYKSGIYSEATCSKTALDHGIAVIGWGQDGDAKFWIVKNSWGTRWGIQGYFWIVRGSDMCGLARAPLFVEYGA